jgi:inorganic triphosphatase YgiF
MQEIELKVQIPAHALDAVRTAVSALPGGTAPAQVLQAAYFDTPDRRLARARAALRVRREDDERVQTLKAAGINAMTRLEDNRPVPHTADAQVPRPDLALHEGDARAALMRDLTWTPDTDPHGALTGLQALYRTDIRRRRARVPIVSEGRTLGTVELALDEGWIEAGTLRRPVCELEIELIDGQPAAVLVAAHHWVTAHGLWLDAQTKAHRGDQLAREAASGIPSPAPPVRRRTPAPRPGALATPDARRQAALNAALEQVGLNLSEVAAGDAPDGSRWAHAAAVGLRRLQRLGLPAGLAAEVAMLYRTLRPAPGRIVSGADAVALARASATTRLQLDLLACLLQPAA